VKINIIGGGPAGLYFAILMKKADPAHDISVYERNGPDDTFGWGVVFSGKTLAHLRQEDEVSHRRITSAFAAWDNVDVVHRDQKITVRGNSFSGIGRLQLLKILQARGAELGVQINFKAEISDVDQLAAKSDLLLGADGINSTVREKYKQQFQPTLAARPNKYIWYGTNQLFHGLTLTFRENEGGIFAAHSYKFNQTTSTFIIECDPQTWTEGGFATMTEGATRAYLEQVFANDLNGEPLLSNNSKWLNFLNVKNGHWNHGNVVLLGDALHTAHFSIGSGTKLALEDAIALKQSFDLNADVHTALAEFERVRKPVIEEYQAAALESCVWFENARQYMHLTPLELAYTIMTRSGRVHDESLRKRDPEFMAAYERAAHNSNCFRAGTEVKTGKGMKAIESIRPGEQVWTHRRRLQTVLGLQVRPHSGRMIGIRLENSSVTVWVTPDHRFLLPFSPSPQAERGEGGEVGARFDPTPLPPSPLAGRGKEKHPSQRLGGYNPSLIKFSRKLRSEATSAESLLWEYLRGRRLVGAKFRRQHPLGPNYIVDFYCPEVRLAIELDGTVHDTARAEWSDGIRHRQIQLAGVRVLRFRNERVFDDLEQVLHEIADHIFSANTTENQEAPQECWRAAVDLFSGDEIIADEDGSIATIKSIEYLLVQEAVYDLTVREDHSFVTRAGVAHNCNES
jgi:2-polyprenyl-6-methoxyphenol hydroxylase-like FAD-dependent oxidoreductase/very-short-patch-repair endonuclease